MFRVPDLSVVVRHHFSAAHRVVGLEGAGAKCRNVHGHTFGVEWRFTVLDTSAQDVEFGAVKSVLRGWVDQHMDHGCFVAKTDLALGDALAQLGSTMYVLEGQPTVEAITVEIAEVTQKLLPALHLLSVSVSEGASNAATWTA